METVTVNAKALRQVLEALNGPGHYIRELQVTRDLPGVENPIDTLTCEFNAAVEAFNANPAWRAGSAGTVALPSEIAAIAERLHTQDNRITDNPLFAVQQKRRVYGLDEDYEEGHGWSHPDRDNLVLEGEPEFAELESAWESGEEPRGDWRRVGFRDTWEFVTGGLTEQGCKDYIARNGHNLTEPRIYAYGSYRNAEFIALRKWLMSLVPAPASADQPHVGPKAEEAAES